jgi:type I restriction enzyme, S subunit
MKSSHQRNQSRYRHSEVGIIPVDWSTVPLESIVVSNGLVRGPFGGTLKKEFFVDRGYKVYEQRNAIYATVDKGDYFIDWNKFRELERFRVYPGDFIVSCSGTIGSIYRIPREAPEGVINQALLKISLNSELVNYEFFLAVFRSESFQGRIKENSHGGAMQNLVGMDVFRKTLFPLPPLAEQHAIAEVLGDADALIESLEQLIAKKRTVKQGVMQELFHPKVEWVATKLGSLGVFLKGSGVRKDDTQSGDIPCIRYGEIYTKHSDYIKAFYSWISPAVASTARRLKVGDVLFAGSGETKEEIGKCVAFVDDVVAYAGGDIVILRPEKVCPLFLGYYLNTAPINRQKASRGQGDAVVHIGSTALADIDLMLPPSVAEQTAIAAILSDMDEEIAGLEAKLTKTRQVKQGMMQELLTGRIRLV